METQSKENKQTDPVEKTMRKVVIGFIVISTLISLAFLWFESGNNVKKEPEVHIESGTNNN